MVGAQGMKWSSRASGMTDLTFGGDYGMPSVGNTVSPNGTNFIGQVIIYAEEISLNDLAKRVLNAPSINTIGELKTLAYDASDSTNINDFIWLKCDGRAVSK